jgi:hypothetical protein
VHLLVCGLKHRRLLVLHRMQFASGVSQCACVRACWLCTVSDVVRICCLSTGICRTSAVLEDCTVHSPVQHCILLLLRIWYLVCQGVALAYLYSCCSYWWGVLAVVDQADFQTTYCTVLYCTVYVSCATRPACSAAMHGSVCLLLLVQTYATYAAQPSTVQRHSCIVWLPSLCVSGDSLRPFPLGIAAPATLLHT